MAILQKLLSDRDLQVDAVRGLAAFDNPNTPQLLIERWNGFQPAAQREAVNTLASRATYARVLLTAIAEQRLSREAISPFHVRQLLTLGDDAIRDTVAQLWPELEQVAAAKVQRIADYRERLTPATLAAADLSAGRQVYQRVCANCHVLFGQGGKVGPDLTGAQRSNLNYLLENIVDPSATVSENFRMAVVITVDGRVLNGVLAEKTDRTVTVATPTDRIVLAVDEIEEIRSSNLSIMPEGQLDLLTADQARDLVAYLMSPQQVELP
jgi:putative heme-binding domain-containing protein